MELKELGNQWLAAKAVEAKAVADRVAIEEKIIAVTGKKDEGAQTHDADGLKITIKAVINRRMDWGKWEEVQALIPAELRPVKYKPELDDKGVKWLQSNRPDLYTLLPIEVKPGKTGVEVKGVV